jgi:glycosyltransferase involved in cell wall biosynthesis
MNGIKDVSGKGNLKVCLLSDHHICMNPRLWKEAFFYEQQGFEVVIITMWQSKPHLLKDEALLKGHNIQYKPYLNLIPGETRSIYRFFYRARKRIACEIQKLFKKGSGWAISHAPERMLSSALAENADLYSAHLECAFFVGRSLIKKDKKVSFDFEDWYSRDYLVRERPVALLEVLEKFALDKGRFCTAASASMALALKEYYSCKREVTVIYNGFPGVALTKSKSVPIPSAFFDPIKLLWFSRTIGPDRGIEFFLNALRVCDSPVELHLLGSMAEGYEAFLQEAFPAEQGHSLIIHPFMPHDRLLDFIAQFKIGLAIEENVNDNRQLTITNKILQYLQSGLQVLASNTKGQREVASYFKSKVFIVDIENPGEVANAIEKMSKNEHVEEENSYEKIFSWDAQEGKLKRLLEEHL